jgi:hypothetical protein
MGWMQIRQDDFNASFLNAQKLQLNWLDQLVRDKFRFLFILKDLAFLELMQFILRIRFLVYPRLKIMVLMLNGCVHP